MGYNNNHAGMHVIWYSRRKSFDDLEYYDRLAEEARKKVIASSIQNLNNNAIAVEEKELATEKVEMVPNINQTHDSNKKQDESTWICAETW